MSPLQGVLFSAFAVLLVVWFICMMLLARLMRGPHPEEYRELELAEMWNDESGSPTLKLVGFLWRREYLALKDERVARLGGSMRLLFVVQVIVFATFMASIAWSPGKAREDAAAVAPTPGDALRARAAELHRQKKWAEAIAVYDQLLGPIGADAELVYWRGMARWQLRHDDEALVDFRRVIDLAPGNLDAYRNADRILSSQRRWDDCIDLWNRYLRAVPRDADAHYERAGSYYYKGDLQAAHADLLKACEFGKPEACTRAERLKSRL